MTSNITNTQMNITLSYSSLALYLECPRCFWFEKVKKIKRPPSIMPSLPSGMDEVIKRYFDRYRQSGELPPELRGKVEGTLIADQELLEVWRNWRKGVRYTDPGTQAQLMGALDDCLTLDDAYIPLDYKTRGYPIQPNTPRYYQNQLDTYTLLLAENGYNHLSYAYLLFFHPLECTERGEFRFHAEPVKVKTDPERARKIFLSAVDILMRDEPPEVGPSCQHCPWVQQVVNA